MITRRLAVLAIGATVLLTAGCGNSGGGASADPTPTRITSVSLQLRPVVTEVEAKGSDCDLAVVSTPPLIKPIPKICNVDKTVLYSLGKAVVGQNQVKTVELVDLPGSPSEKAAVLTLDAPGTAAFAGITGDASKKDSPKNQVALVVDGQVVSSPEVSKETGPITGGSLQVSFADGAAAKAFYDSWPAERQK